MRETLSARIGRNLHHELYGLWDREWQGHVAQRLQYFPEIQTFRVVNYQHIKHGEPTYMGQEGAPWVFV